MKPINNFLVRIIVEECKEKNLDIASNVSDFLNYEGKLQFREAYRGLYHYANDEEMNKISLHALDVYKRYMRIKSK